MQDVRFQCNCGKLNGIVREAAPKSACHLVCYCKDCRAFARHLGQMAALEPGGGSPLVQVLPARIEITEGRENLACLKLSSRGLLRWYASCCDTPLANTVSTPKVPLAGMWRPNFSSPEAFGPVTTLGFTKMALPGGPKKDTGLFRMLSGLFSRYIFALTSGQLRDGPFFAPDGTPVVAPKVMTGPERKDAYAEGPMG